MSKLLILCGILSTVLGGLQIFFPNTLDHTDKKINAVFGDKKTFDSRKLSGFILILIGLVLIYMAVDTTTKIYLG